MHKRWVYSLINSNTREDVWSHHTEQDIEYLPHPRRLPYAPSQQSLPPFLLKRDSRVKEVSGCLGNQELIWRVWNPMGAVESQATECPVPAHPGPPSAPVMAGFLSARRSADSSEHILVLCTNGSALNLENTVCPNTLKRFPFTGSQSHSSLVCLPLYPGNLCSEIWVFLTFSVTYLQTVGLLSPMTTLPGEARPV